MDTYSIGTSYLVIGYIPCVYYHHCRSRRLFSMVSTNINMHQNDIPLFILYIL